MKTMPWLARAVRERRLALGREATQQRIAFRANLSIRQLQKIERARTMPRLTTLLALMHALETDLQTMLDRAETLQRRHRAARVRKSRLKSVT